MSTEGKSDAATTGVAELLENFCGTATYAAEDMSEKHMLVYNLDFSMMRPYLFSRSNDKQNKFYPQMKEVSRKVLKSCSHSDPYRLAVSGAMVYEFLDQLVHGLEQTSRLITEVQSKSELELVLDSVLKTKDLKCELQNDALTSRLQMLTKDGIRDSVTIPTQMLMKLIDEGVIRGVGDYISQPDRISVEEIRKKFWEIVALQEKKRFKTDNRPKEDSIFHYKMDAINVCLSLFFSRENSDGKVLFVTPTGANIESCKTDEYVYGRDAFVPLFIKNAIALEKNHYCKNKFKFLFSALNEAAELSEIYQAGDVTDWDKNRFRQFMDNFYFRLFETGEYQMPGVRKEMAEEIREVFDSRKKFTNHVEEMQAEAISATKKLLTHAEKFGLHQMDWFDMKEDPIFKRIRSTLSVR